MSKSQKIYVEQFGCYWSFKPKDFIDLLKSGAKNGYFTLPTSLELKSKPSRDKRDFAYSLLDWEKEDFEYELKYLKQQGLYPNVYFD